jgi:hypothetical protein
MRKQEQLLPDVQTSSLDLLHALAQHQFLSVAQLAALLEAHADEVIPMLDGLVARKLVTKLCGAGTIEAPAAATAYAVTRRGAAVLGAATGERTRAPDRRKSLFMLDHDLCRNDLFMVLTQLHRRGALELLRWETARAKLADSVWLRTRGKELRVPLVPDALAVLRVAGRVSALIVEIDRGTVSSSRMQTKYLGYHAWWKTSGPARRFGLSAVRVLTIAPTQKRVSQLRAVAEKAVAGSAPGLFWFGTQSSVDTAEPSRLLSTGWSRAGDAPLQPLFDVEAPAA